jgi:hypothetical protein
MRFPRLTLIIVSIAILAAITLTAIKFRSVKAQQNKAAKAPVTTNVAQQTAEGDGGTVGPSVDTTHTSDVDLYLDADEVERQAQAEQAADQSAAAVVNKIPVSFKHVPIPLPGGVDHAVAGVGTRNSGQGVIRLRGVPPGSTLLFAWLVWGEISTQAQVLNAYPVTFKPNCTACANPAVNVVGTPFPFPFNPAVQPCWNGAGQFWAYQADVTNQIVAGINGDYQIRGLRSAITNNRCPWGDGPGCASPGNALILSEGASLIVGYSNACIPRAAQLFIHFGPRRHDLGQQVNIHNTLFPTIRPNMPNLKHSRIGGDGQVGAANCGLRTFIQAPIINWSDERTWIENLNPALCSIQITGDGGLNRDSDWNGDDGQPLNKLWDSHTDFFASNSNCLAAGGGLGYRVRYQSQGDCWVWVAHILGVR